MKFKQQNSDATNNPSFLPLANDDANANDVCLRQMGDISSLRHAVEQHHICEANTSYRKAIHHFERSEKHHFLREQKQKRVTMNIARVH